MSFNLAWLGSGIISYLEGLGKYTIFCFEGTRRCFLPLMNLRLVIQQMEFVGNRSLGIIIMAGFMVGGIFGFQLGEIFGLFGAESLIGASTGFALSRELAPIVGSFLVTARAGSAMSAELATMKVNEQIDAMRVMAVNPYSYLVAPRITGAVLMMPLLSVIFVVSGVFASFIIGSVFYKVDTADFFSKIEWMMQASDIWMGMQKSALFGFVFATIGCYQGFITRGGAKGVGKATTNAVVSSYVTILVLDFFITYSQFKGFDIFLF
ncbi:MlaE family ABC transporter permease [Pseudobacteriovorax antillogorgiicola]|uniref:Phospholipid/cholesterol/gamma-HCH transport system permease protein n=1 Tax=Pseudobacteriovorax antillogorgiicola TaxID=1513793 RepID=A0A1Y6CHA6_9BACT|nr:ABC transporter permease [Pseudobacteriovorax antillogorgiicola]TCS48687.1 phospholipid/cholesterol/gamma-HCH transport system permease protein [Pseudobacteriovorax antillogorgiicola]SMF54803.1 phospholipid/cholesterol/gamma-HCH transport system permease protein [Pseudobacteriovorax antillogorgiicola]